MSQMRLLALLATFALVACGNPSGGDVDDADAMDSSSDTGAEVSDVGALDVGDIGSDLGDVPSPGEFGDVCADDGDCVSFLCVDIAPGEVEGFCSVQCTGDRDCPEDFDCVVSSGSGTDALQVCLPESFCVDADQDGFGIGPDCLGRDCDDSVASINPRASEICDGIDNDCDQVIDDNPVDTGEVCETGFDGVCGAGTTQCIGGIVRCNQQSSSSAEVCDGVDNDCDGEVDTDDSGMLLERSCFGSDPSVIGVGECVTGVQICGDDGFGGCVGEVAPSTEFCDGLDNDCDGSVDEGLQALMWWPDGDADGFGDATADPVESCQAPDEDHVSNGGDCDDNNNRIYAGAPETAADGIDSDCDGEELCYEDADDDTFHAGVLVGSASLSCDGSGITSDGSSGGDCNDEDGAIYPGASEAVGDEVDSDCDGVELCYADSDNDGFRVDTVIESPNEDCTNDGEATASEPAGDCDDALASVFPDAPELCDGIDNDCVDGIDNDTVTVDFYVDDDMDGFGDVDATAVPSCNPVDGSVTNNLDCDDGNASVNPIADEIVGDGFDQDCDGVELCWFDADGDGYHDDLTVESMDTACDGAEEGDETTAPGDCDNSDPLAFPGADEIPGDEIDQSCDGAELCYADVDGDGYRTDTTQVSSDADCQDLGEAPASLPGGDCADNQPAVSPGATERPADSVDQNCDGNELCYVDGDGDGVRPDGVTTVTSVGDLSCSEAGEAIGTDPIGDCDDTDPLTSPQRAEQCSSVVDNDCDGVPGCWDNDCQGDGMCTFGNAFDFEVWDSDGRPVGHFLDPGDASSVSRSSDPVCSGLYAAQVTWTSPTESLRSATVFPVVGSDVYTAHAWVLDEGSGSAELGMVEMDGSRTTLRAVAGDTSQDTMEWQELTVEYEPGGAALWAAPILNLDGTSGSIITDDWAVSTAWSFETNDQTVDASSTMIAENGGLPLYAAVSNAGRLYLGTDNANSGSGDRFVFAWVGVPSGSVDPPWNKSGTVPGPGTGGGVFVLAQEESNSYCEWRRYNSLSAQWEYVGGATCSADQGRALEGDLDLSGALGLPASELPALLHFAVVTAGGFDAEPIVAGPQAPSGDGDESLQAAEVMSVHRSAILSGRLDF